MNRREMFLAGGALAAASAVGLPTVAAESREVSRESLGPMTLWWGGAKYNPHTPLVEAWIKEQHDQGCIYARSGIPIFGYKLVLETPFYVISPGKPVWRFMDGESDEPGLEIALYEGDLLIDKFGIGSTHGFSQTEERYMVRGPYLDYDESKAIREALGDKLSYDDRWFKQATKTLEQGRGAAAPI